MILMLILILFLVFFFLDSRIANFPVAIKLMPWKKRYGSAWDVLRVKFIWMLLRLGVIYCCSNAVKGSFHGVKQLL